MGGDDGMPPPTPPDEDLPDLAAQQTALVADTFAAMLGKLEALDSRLAQIEAGMLSLAGEIREMRRAAPTPAATPAAGGVDIKQLLLQRLLAGQGAVASTPGANVDLANLLQQQVRGCTNHPQAEKGCVPCIQAIAARLQG